METISCTLTLDEINNLRQKHQMALIKKTPPYALFQIEVNSCVITAYNSLKVVFQGENAESYASLYTQNTKKPNSPKTSHTQQNTFPQAGSDEVGTGDYFGPVCVCACFVDEKNAKFLEQFHIQDSKMLKDAYIEEIAPQIINSLPHSMLILENEHYNNVQKTHNMVAMKCKLHNQAYVHLKKKLIQLPKLCVVDQFVPEKNYYAYLKNEQAIIKSLHFETKAENKYLSVACASILARYTFLQVWKKMEENYKFTFPKGAGKKVDEALQRFIKEFGENQLNKVAKVHFANTTKNK